MYEQLIFIHSYTRWIVLLATCVILYRLARNVSAKDWSSADDHLLKIHSQVFGFQVAFGLTLWIGVSPLARAVVASPNAVFDTPVLNFFFLRHPLTMLSAFIFYLFGILRLKKLTKEKKARWMLLVLAISVLLILSAIPWPWLEVGRPLFRIPR